MTPEGIGEMDGIALVLHEFYSSLMRAGFTDDQALQLVKIHLRAALHNQ